MRRSSGACRPISVEKRSGACTVDYLTRYVKVAATCRGGAYTCVTTPLVVLRSNASCTYCVFVRLFTHSAVSQRPSAASYDKRAFSVVYALSDSTGWLIVLKYR